MSAAVSLQEVSCVFGTGPTAVRAVDCVSLDIEAGEFFTLLGPSGSGKTTCLRMIGGFTLPTQGVLRIDGADVTALPPYARPVNTVFQDYALFPHMTITDNVAYALMVRGVARAERERRAGELLELVRLSGMGARKPAQLSGGQRQRVALARALISQPRVLLLDEPLGALDLKLREQMQTELKNLQRQLGITFVFVTHDQHEALSMSDRIGVFNGGRLEQVATPGDLYDRPATRFVAEFVGTANLMDGTGQCMMIRPERIRLGPATGARVSGRVCEVQYFGSFWRVRVQPGPGGTGGAAPMDADTGLLADVGSGGATPPAVGGAGAAPPAVGDTVHLHWDDSAVHRLAGS